MRRFLMGFGLVLLVGLLAIQLVPYGRDHSNPPVSDEPAWDSDATRTAAVGACYDCHSNETKWPLYANVAPFSWVLQRHVDEGRAALNFSEWGSGEQGVDEIVESVREGEMPTWDYALLHPEARMSGAALDDFIAGLTATFGAGEGEGGAGEGDGGSHGDDD